MVRQPPAQVYSQVSDPALKKGELKKSIPFSILLLLAINAIIGTGIFFVPGIAAGIAGPASLISWVAVASMAIFIAACFAELSGMFPKCGGVYEYTKQAFGEFGGYLVGWTSWIVANVTIAMLTIGSLDYLGTIVPIPHWQKLAFCVAFLMGMNYISFRGIDMSVKVLLVFAIFTILSLWTLFSWGIYHVNLAHLSLTTFLPLFPKVSLTIAMLYIMETFFGWETVAYLSEETKDAQHVIPKVMMWATVAVCLLAIAVVTVTLGVVPWEQLAASASPLVDAAIVFMGTTGAKFMAILIFLNIIGGAAAWIVVTPRLVYALARDKLLPESLGKVHPKHNTPHMAILLQTFLSIAIVLAGAYKFLLEMLLPMAVFMYSMVIVSVAILRFTKPHLTRTFKVPWGKYSPIIIALIMLFLAGAIEIGTIVSGALFILIGIPLYLITVIKYKPEVIRDFLNISAGLTKLTYKWWLSKKTRRRIIHLLGSLKAGRIFNPSCNIGILAVDLSKFVGPQGKIFATDLSDKQINEAQKYALENKSENIQFILEDPAGKHKIHQDIHSLHGAASVDMLSYLEDPKLFLCELNRRMHHQGRIYFVEFDKVFGMRTQSWLQEDQKAIQAFAQCGFHIKIEREKKLFWETIHLLGYKVR